MHPSSQLLLLIAVGCPTPEPTPSEPEPTSRPVPPVCDELERLENVAPSWRGDIGTCDAGEPDAATNDAALARVNFLRSLADLPPVRTLDPADATGCALLLDANDALSHAPPTDWACFDPTWSDAAGRSLIASDGSLDVVFAFAIDPGNEDAFGHRRWLLSSWLTGAAFGATPDYACLDLDLGDDEQAAWTAWPPPGDTPAAVLELFGYATDRTGWSLQSDSLELSGDLEVILSHGSTREVLTPVQLPAGFGSRRAIRFVPERPVPVGVVWTVEVNGLTDPIRYEGRKVACPEAA